MLKRVCYIDISIWRRILLESYLAAKQYNAAYLSKRLLGMPHLPNSPILPHAFIEFVIDRMKERYSS